MQSRFLKFYDFIIDGDQEKAKKFFENPFMDVNVFEESLDFNETEGKDIESRLG